MLTRRQSYLLDAVAALVFAVLGVGGMPGGADGPHPTLAVVLVLAGSLPVAARRRWPRSVFGVVFVAAVLDGLLGDGPGPGLYAAAFGLYTIASTTNRPSWEPTLAIGISTGGLALLATAGGSAPGVDLAGVFLGTLSFGTAWTIGRAVRARREYQDQLLRRYAEHAVAEDRLRIARDLHDVIAHSLSMIAVKSGVAGHVASDQPEQAAEALRTIETTSRDTLGEVRRILGVLRSSDTAEWSMPALLDLADLAGETERNGPPVRLALGEPGEPLEISTVPFDMQLTAYRIVQEALTNVRRHSWASECEVRLTRVEDELWIEVTDDGTGVAGEPSDGNGLRGMRERVRMYGGSLRVGNREPGGFQVWAVLPLTSVGQPS